MLATSLPDGCLSDLVLDEWLAEDLSAGERSRLKEHLASCARCRLRAHAIATQKEQDLVRMPSWSALRDATRPRDRAAAPAHPGKARWVLFAGVAAAATLLLTSLSDESPLGDVRTKSAPARIGVYVKRGPQAARAMDGERVRPGDMLRFTYSATDPLFFALLNKDARRATKYHPLGPRSVRVEPGRDVPLDFSITLDDTPGVERVFGIFCREAQDLSPLLRQLEDRGQLAETPGCSIDTLTLIKQENGE